MWTQFSETKYDILSGALTVDLLTPLDSSVSEGDWIIVTPLKDICEIRKIQSIISSTQITINTAFNNTHTNGDIIYITTSPNWDILLFGAIPNDILSAGANTTAFRNAIKDLITNCGVTGVIKGGIISIPVGEYFLDKDGSTDNCINLSGINNIQFIGEGNGNNDMVSRLIPTDYNCTIFYLDNSTNVSFDNITLDGNIEKTGNCGINILGQGTSVEANITLNEVQFIYLSDCGLRTIYTRKQIIKQCSFFQCNQGLNIFDESWNIWIEDCFFRNNINEDILIDSSSDDSSTAYIVSCLIKNNIFERDAALSSTTTALKILSTTNYSLLNYKFIITNNEFHDCNIYIEYCKEIIFANNIIIGATSGIPFEAKNTIEEFCFEKNYIKINSASENAFMLHSTDYVSTIHFCPKNIIVAGNNFEQGQCYFENVNNLTFQNNNVRNSSNEPLNAGFYLKLTNYPDLFSLTDYGSLSIANNQIWGDFSTGIYINSYDTNYRLNLINIESNTITNTQRYGIFIDRLETTILQYWSKLLISKSNTIINPTIDIDVFTFYLIEINPFQEFWITKGIPGNIDNQIYTPQGSLAIDNTLVADNNYSKNSYKDYLNGWELTSEMGKQTLFRSYFNNNGTIPPPTTYPLIDDIPEIKVFSPTPVNFWEDIYAVGWDVTNSEAYANNISSYGTAVALTKGDIDFEIKTLMRVDTTTIPTTGFSGGIAFRYDPGGGNDFLIYYLNDDGSGNRSVECKEVNSGSIGSTVFGPISVNKLNKVVLKIIMKGDILSFFYNELLIKNIEYSYCNTGDKHGLFCDTIGNIFFQNFKQLIP